MELIYSMRRKPLKCEPPHFESPTDTEVVRPICTVSICNIIAFSSPTELSDVEGDTWGGHVYVCDLDTPWDSHKVTGTAHPVSALEWDNEGKQLLVATTAGDVSVYGQKEYLLNEWTCLYSAAFPGEHIIKASFFHNGRRVVAADKKSDALIAEKFQTLRAAPTLKGFGGIACEGAVIVTATGLVGSLSVPAEGGHAVAVTESLRPSRDHVTAASIAHKNGNLLIAALCAPPAGWMVRVSVCSAASPPPALQPQPLPAVRLHPPAAPVSVAWCLREDTDSLLVAGAALTLWKLTERSHAVHKLLVKGPLQGNTTPGGGPKPGTDSFNTVVWQQMAAWPIEGNECAVAVASNKLPLTAPYCLLATPRAVHLISRDKHHYVSSRPIVTSGAGAVETPAGAATPPKKTKYGPGALPGGCARARVSCVSLCALGGAAVVVDSHAQLHVYRLPQPAPDNPIPVAVQHMCNLLEYSMVSGVDCLDLMMTMKPALIEPLYERLTETFLRQPPAFQQYYFHSWLKLRIALCRLSPGLAWTASWVTCLQVLAASWAAVSIGLRADDKPEQAAAIEHLLEDHHDQEKSLLSLESKPESCGEVSLWGLRRPLQRALDIALTALLASAHHQPPHGYELLSDPTALMLLRKLVLVARASGCGGEPLSRPLARRALLPNKGGDLQEECLPLSGQPPSARVWECLPRCAVSAPHARPPPLYLEYGVEPEHLRYSPEPPSFMQCDSTPSYAMDSIRYMYLGGGRRAARWRACGRCGARALPAAQPARHPLQRAHDARFLLACRCGGKWTLFSNVEI